MARFWIFGYSEVEIDRLIFRGGRTALAFRWLESPELGFLTMLINDASSADVRIYGVVSFTRCPHRPHRAVELDLLQGGVFRLVHG